MSIGQYLLIALVGTAAVFTLAALYFHDPWAGFAFGIAFAVVWRFVPYKD